MAADAREQALFQERILDHYRRPRHRRTIERPSGAATRRNPACGEHVEAAVAIEGDVVRDAAFSRVLTEAIERLGNFLSSYKQ